MHVQEGIGYMRAAVALRPQSAHAIMNLGNGYNFLGQHDQAIACYRKAIELAPRIWACYANLGIALARKGLYEEAIAAFEQAIKLRRDRSNARAYAELSMIHSTAQTRTFATSAGRRSWRRKPSSSNRRPVIIGPHSASRATGKVSGRKRAPLLTSPCNSEQIARAADHRWADAIDWFFLAMCHWQLGQKDQARQCYDRAVAMDGEGSSRGEMDVEQLRRFRTEAEELLKITDEKPTTKPQSK